MVEEVAAGIYKIPSILGSRRFAQWLVVGDEVMLIDTGVDGTVKDHVMPALDHLGIEPVRVTHAVISHADVDHYGGDAEVRHLLPRASIRASAADRRLLESWEIIGAERYGWYRQHGIDYDPDTFAWLRNAAGPDTPIDGTVEGGDIIDLGGISMEVLALPGHSLGHIGVWHGDTGTAIVMDAVLERGLYSTDGRLISPPPYVTVPGYRATIEHLRSLAPERLGTSHYPPTEGRSSVDAFLAATASFVDELDQSVLNTLAAAPQPLEVFWQIAEVDTGPFPEMAIELARSVGAHLEDAEQRGLAIRVNIDGKPAWKAAE